MKAIKDNSKKLNHLDLLRTRIRSVPVIKIEIHSVDVDRVIEMMQDMRKLPNMDYATLSVAVRSLGQLISATDE